MTFILQGKVKTVFTTDDPNKVLIQYENKVTAGNGRKELFLEDKGRICCEISSIIFQKLEIEIKNTNELMWGHIKNAK